jgi:Uri superfamily endonuclease
VTAPRVASRPAETPPGLNLLYVVATWLPRRETIVVGALGPVTFARGWYAYVGSARRGRDARVARHGRADKPLRWHADYLFARHPATRAWLLDTPLSECEVAARLRATGEPESAGARSGPAASTAARFGASNCGCPGHLARAPRLGVLQAALATVPVCSGRLRPGSKAAIGRRP